MPTTPSEQTLKDPRLPKEKLEMENSDDDDAAFRGHGTDERLVYVPEKYTPEAGTGFMEEVRLSWIDDEYAALAEAVAARLPWVDVQDFLREKGYARMPGECATRWAALITRRWTDEEDRALIRFRDENRVENRVGWNAVVLAMSRNQFYRSQSCCENRYRKLCEDHKRRLERQNATEEEGITMGLQKVAIPDADVAGGKGEGMAEMEVQPKANVRARKPRGRDHWNFMSDSRLFDCVKRRDQEGGSWEDVSIWLLEFGIQRTSESCRLRYRRVMLKGGWKPVDNRHNYRGGRTSALRGITKPKSGLGSLKRSPARQQTRKQHGSTQERFPSGSAFLAHVVNTARKSRAKAKSGNVENDDGAGTARRQPGGDCEIMGDTTKQVELVGDAKTNVAESSYAIGSHGEKMRSAAKAKQAAKVRARKQSLLLCLPISPEKTTRKEGGSTIVRVRNSKTLPSASGSPNRKHMPKGSAEHASLKAKPSLTIAAAEQPTERRVASSTIAMVAGKQVIPRQGPLTSSRKVGSDHLEPIIPNIRGNALAHAGTRRAAEDQIDARSKAVFSKAGGQGIEPGSSEMAGNHRSHHADPLHILLNAGSSVPSDKTKTAFRSPRPASQLHTSQYSLHAEKATQEKPYARKTMPTSKEHNAAGAQRKLLKSSHGRGSRKTSGVDLGARDNLSRYGVQQKSHNEIGRNLPILRNLAVVQSLNTVCGDAPLQRPQVEATHLPCSNADIVNNSGNVGLLGGGVIDEDPHKVPIQEQLDGHTAHKQGSTLHAKLSTLPPKVLRTVPRPQELRISIPRRASPAPSPELTGTSDWVSLESPRNEVMVDDTPMPHLVSASTSVLPLMQQQRLNRTMRLGATDAYPISPPAFSPSPPPVSVMKTQRRSRIPSAPMNHSNTPLGHLRPPDVSQDPAVVARANKMRAWLTDGYVTERPPASSVMPNHELRTKTIAGLEKCPATRPMDCGSDIQNGYHLFPDLLESRRDVVEWTRGEDAILVDICRSRAAGSWLEVAALLKAQGHSGRTRYAVRDRFNSLRKLLRTTAANPSALTAEGSSMGPSESGSAAPEVISPEVRLLTTAEKASGPVELSAQTPKGGEFTAGAEKGVAVTEPTAEPAREGAQDAPMHIALEASDEGQAAEVREASVVRETPEVIETPEEKNEIAVDAVRRPRGRSRGRGRGKHRGRSSGHGWTAKKKRREPPRWAAEEDGIISTAAKDIARGVKDWSTVASDLRAKGYVRTADECQIRSAILRNLRQSAEGSGTHGNVLDAGDAGDAGDSSLSDASGGGELGEYG